MLCHALLPDCVVVIVDPSAPVQNQPKPPSVLLIISSFLVLISAGRHGNLIKKEKMV